MKASKDSKRNLMVCIARNADTYLCHVRKKSTAQEDKRGQALVSAFTGKKRQGMSKRRPSPPDLLRFNCSYFH